MPVSGGQNTEPGSALCTLWDAGFEHIPDSAPEMLRWNYPVHL